MTLMKHLKRDTGAESFKGIWKKKHTDEHVKHRWINEFHNFNNNNNKKYIIKDKWIDNDAYRQRHNKPETIQHMTPPCVDCLR